MLSRLKTAIARLRGKTTDDNAQTDYDISYQPEDDVLRQKLQEYRSKATDFLEPVKKNWKFIEDTLLWKNHFPACICFFLISGIFWKFIGMKFRKTALILGAFLLANGISSDVKANCWDFFHRNLHLEVKEEERLPFNFDELCLGIGWACLLYFQCVSFVQDLKKDSPSKFYCFLSVLLFSVLTLFTYFPVIEFIYVLVCCLFFYPSLNHYGVMDRLEARIQFLMEPVKRHWENNRTKRRRKLQSSSTSPAYVVDTDDEFRLERDAFTTDVLESMVPGDRENTHEVNNEVASDRLVDYHNDDTEEDDFDESHFAQGLSLPSMSKFDSMMEPYDEFHAGLRFPDVNDSVILDTERILNAAANNLDTDDEDIDELPYEDDETDMNQRPERNFEDIPSGPTSHSHQQSDHELRHRPHSLMNLNQQQPNRDLPFDDTSEIEESTRAVETDFEFLDHQDLYDMDANNVPNSVASASEKNPNDQQSPTYTQSGIATVSKWLGYE